MVPAALHAEILGGKEGMVCTWDHSYDHARLCQALRLENPWVPVRKQMGTVEQRRWCSGN